MFTTRSMDEQYQVLRDALWLLLTYPDTRAQREPTILGGIARTHAQFEPRLSVKGKIVELVDLSKTPQWARALVAAAVKIST